MESITETIIRHQDLGGPELTTRSGARMTELTAVIHLATLFDNAGANAQLVHGDTVKAVVRAHPRGGWTGCFAGVLREEMGGKPWSNSTRVEGFIGLVEGNELMREYD